MTDERIDTGKLTRSVVQFALDSRSLQRDRLAEILRTDQSYIARLLEGQRQLDLGQFSTIAQELHLPLGELLIQSQDHKVSISHAAKSLAQRCDELSRLADAAVELLEAEDRNEQALRKSAS
jgi:transcriptional regulator with XRE-family HTH domain